jgi:hypothetical protein
MLHIVVAVADMVVVDRSVPAPIGVLIAAVD